MIRPTQLLLVGHTWCITRLLRKNPRSETLACSRDGLLKLPRSRSADGRGGRKVARTHTRWKKVHQQVCLRSLLSHRSVLSQKSGTKPRPRLSTMHPNNPSVRAHPAPQPFHNNKTGKGEVTTHDRNNTTPARKQKDEKG